MGSTIKKMISERIILSTYGCNLDHKSIHNLIHTHLAPFQIMSDEIPVCIPNEKLLVSYDVYDANLEKDHISSNFSFQNFLLKKEHLIAFEQALNELNIGMPIRCFDARGHIWVTLNDLEYDIRTLISSDNNTKFAFINRTEEGNDLIRNKLHLLPDELRYLIIHQHVMKSYEDQQEQVKEWILTIHQYLNEVKGL